MSKIEEQVLGECLQEVRTRRELTPSVRKKLSDAFGARFQNALAAIEEGKVKRLTFYPSRRTVFLVSGKKRDYLILPRSSFCSCEDFFFRVISREASMCYHLLAQKLAEAQGHCTALEEEDYRYSRVVSPIAAERERPRRLSIRTVENMRQVIAEIMDKSDETSLERIIEAMKELGFPALTKRHLSAILATDKANRFASKGGIWSLRSRTGEIVDK
jgi:predicted nucleic acid-binding Zn finger protein